MSHVAPDRRMSLVTRVAWVGLPAGPIVAVTVYLLLPRVAGDGSGLSDQGRAAAAVAVLMAAWWLTQAIPLSATALLPIVLFPLLGVASVGTATAPYASDLIFLFMGGFILGLAMQRSGLHRRIALVTIMLVGTRPRRLVGGFMLATALMSMWVSNTATAVMMLPIGMSVVELVFSRLRPGADPIARGERRPGDNFATCVMLAIAYGASIGGLATLIGTPPNLVLAGFIKRTYAQEISFAAWMRLGVPLVALFLPLAWFYLTTIAFPIRLTELPGGRELIADEYRRLGRVTREERAVMAVFVLAVLLWVFRDLLVRHVPGFGGLTDTTVAVGAALLLFVIPVDPRRGRFVMDWESAEKLPWGILLLFGGGLSLAAAMTATGVDRFIGGGLAHAAGLPTPVIVLLVTSLVIFLTELTSNTAVTNAILPILAAAAAGLGVHPYLLLVPAAIAASCAFMLPVATPPNAIVFASGSVTLPQMVKAGFWLNILGIVLTSALVYFGAGRLLGVDLNVIPHPTVGP
jgi:sodium-dependent dicarboxylate transporter 2/3/5